MSEETSGDEIREEKCDKANVKSKHFKNLTEMEGYNVEVSETSSDSSDESSSEEDLQLAGNVENYLERCRNTFTVHY